MKINVTDPGSGTNFEIEANPSEINQQKGWSVILPNSQTIFITLYDGKWEGRNNKIASAELINAIGRAINPSIIIDDAPPGNQNHTEEAGDERDVGSLGFKYNKKN